jgi:hypothetical protein
MAIERVIIKNYRALRSADVKFSDNLNIIVGDRLLRTGDWSSISGRTNFQDGRYLDMYRVTSSSRTPYILTLFT